MKHFKPSNCQKFIDREKNFYFYPGQYFECMSCARCCRVWDVPVTKYEKKRIEKLELVNLSSDKCFLRDKRSGLFILNKQDGRCVFLDSDNKCLIHKKYGEEYKPLACRVYPFDIFLWDDDSISVSLRFDCPAAARAWGKPISDYIVFIRRIAGEIQGTSSKFRAVYSKELVLTTSTIRFITQAFAEFLLSDNFPLPVRLFAAARFLEFYENKENHVDFEECRETFSQELHKILENSLESLSFSILNSEDFNLNDRILFRYLISGYARVDEEKLSSFVPIGRFERCKTVVNFSFGRGSLKQLGKEYPDTLGIDPVSACEGIVVDSDVTEVVEKYMASKLLSMHFCGIPVLRETFEEGMRHLILSIPILFTLAALYAKSHGRNKVTVKDAENALMLVDHTFSRSPFFNLRHVKNAEKKFCSYKKLPIILRKTFSDEFYSPD